MPKKNFILVNRCKYERRHASLPHYHFFVIIGNDNLWKRPFLARQVGWAKLAYKHCNSRTLESTETLQLWDVNDVKQACFRASSNVGSLGTRKRFQEVSRSIYILSSNHPSSFHSFFCQFPAEHFLVVRSHSAQAPEVHQTMLSGKDGCKILQKHMHFAVSKWTFKNNLPIQDVKEKLREWRS